jgi:hypothetical protein
MSFGRVLKRTVDVFAIRGVFPPRLCSFDEQRAGYCTCTFERAYVRLSELRAVCVARRSHYDVSSHRNR